LKGLTLIILKVFIKDASTASSILVTNENDAARFLKHYVEDKITTYIILNVTNENDKANNLSFLRFKA